MTDNKPDPQEQPDGHYTVDSKTGLWRYNEVKPIVPPTPAPCQSCADLQCQLAECRREKEAAEINARTYLGWLEEIGREIGLMNSPGYSHAGVIVALSENKTERDTLLALLRRTAVELDVVNEPELGSGSV